jgi:predicted AAA+ superfamily ATPase
LSGSANFALLKSISESLAGRAIYLTLDPFTRRELLGPSTPLPAVRRLFERGTVEAGKAAPAVTARQVLQGGLPPVCLGLIARADLWFKGYEQTYLERDVRDLSRLVDLVAFRDVLQLALLRTGQVLNISELARDAKQNSTTTARYLSVLEASFVIRRLAPYLRNRASRIIKSPKLYMWGALLETYVAQNLAGILSSEWPHARLAYWHVQGRYEVDFIIEVGRDCVAIEVKAAARWDERDLAGLNAFLERTPRCRAAVLAYGGTEVLRLGDRLWAVPLAVLLA